MNPFLRLKIELSQLRACLTPRDFRQYIARLAKNAPAVISRKTLAPADLAMSGDVAVTVKEKSIVIPLDKMGLLLSPHDPTPTFGGAREMYISNVYLRGFKPDLTAKNVIDLGSNRGLFLALAAKALETKVGVGVEPHEFYTPVFEALLAANDIAMDRFPRICKMASSRPGPDTVTVREIMRDHDMATIDFLKSDIEGGEFDVFFGDNDFLQNVKNIAMELHPDEGDIMCLVEVLEGYGFDIRVADQFNKTISPRHGHYLYASRDGSLLL